MIAMGQSKLCGTVIAILLIGSCTAAAEDALKPVRIQLEVDPFRILRGIGFAADGRTLFGVVHTSAKGNQVVFWDVTTGVQVREFGMDGPPVTSMRVLPGGKSVVTVASGSQFPRRRLGRHGSDRGVEPWGRRPKNGIRIQKTLIHRET